MYQCIAGPGAVPCISDSRFNKDLKDGTINGKVIRTCKHVRKGKVVRWVDPASRKHFLPLDDEARRQDKEDFEFLFDFLTKKGCSFPPDVTLSELGETYNRLDPRLNHVRAKDYVMKKRKFDIVTGVSTEKGNEKEELKAWLKEKNVSFHHASGIEKLRQLKTDKEAELKEEDEE